MNVVPICNDNLQTFFDYCLRYGKEHDPSFVSKQELQEAVLDGVKEVGYLLEDKEHCVVGALSLMIGRYLPKRTSRFRIFHCIEPEIAHYSLLLRASRLEERSGVDSAYLFLPGDETIVRDLMEQLGFAVERYSWGLAKESANSPKAVISPPFQLIPVRVGDEEAWVEVINSAFSQIAGHIPKDLNRAKENLWAKTVIPKGGRILWDGKKPVGIFLVSQEEEEPNLVAEIGPIAVIPEYQRRGLGRELLRAAVTCSFEAGFPKCWLSVNAENKTASDLYIKEGFVKKESFVCLKIWKKGHGTSISSI